MCDPRPVSVNKMIEAGRIETFRRKHCKLCRNSRYVGWHDPWLMVARHPARLQLDAIADQTLDHTAVYADGGVRKKISETVRWLDAIELQRAMVIFRQVNFEHHLMNRVFVAMTLPARHLTTIVFNHHTKITARRIPQVSFNLHEQ